MRTMKIAVGIILFVGVVTGLVAAAPSPVVEAPVITEDDPAWDCRTMGNQVCGVLIEDTWYLVTFENGQPVSVTPR